MVSRANTRRAAAQHSVSATSRCLRTTSQSKESEEEASCRRCSQAPHGPAAHLSSLRGVAGRSQPPQRPAAPARQRWPGPAPPTLPTWVTQAPSSLRGTPMRHLRQHDQAGEPCCPMDKQPHVRNSGIYAASLSSETTVNLPCQSARPHSNPWLGKSHTTVESCGVLMGSEQTIEQEGGLAHSYLSAGAPGWGAGSPEGNHTLESQV